jgi:hypothetical protein
LAEISDDEDEGDDVSLDTEEDSGADKIKAVKVENAFMEEKEQAILALKDLCKYTSDAFMPHLADAAEAIWQLIDFPDEDVRKASVEAATEFAAAYHRRGDASGLEVVYLSFTH